MNKKEMISRRKLLNTKTKQELIKLGKKYNIKIPVSTTKMGMISHLMRHLPTEIIRKEILVL